MPTITASTMTLTPEAMTAPSTRSARKAVRPKSPNGTRTKPARVVSLNELLVHLAGSQQTPGEVDADATFPPLRYALFEAAAAPGGDAAMPANPADQAVA